MKPVAPVSPHPEERLREEAARWVVRRDRGLSATEAIEFELWLAADERHAAAMRRAGQAWGALDRIPDALGAAVSLEIVRRRTRRRKFFVALAAAAALAVGFVGWGRWRAEAPPLEIAAAPELRGLPDGSIVRLNAGAAITEAYVANERAVTLVQGEAHFTVMKDPARPFVVRARGVEVRAVGTAFNVQLQEDAVAVVVTEGRVQVTGANAAVALPAVDAGQRAVIALAESVAAPVAVTALEPEQVAETLAWQEPLLRLGGATLAELAREFQRRSGQQLILADLELAELQVGGRFRADDIDGFVRVLEENYGVHSQRQTDGAIVLRMMPR